MAGSHLALEAVVHHEGQTLARCLIRRGRYIIGHDRKNEIVAAADSVSAKHARLTVASDDQFFLEDLGSANGTFVDGVAIDALTPLTLQSAVGIGLTTLAFERGGLPAAVFPHLPASFLRAQRYVVGRPIVAGRTSTIFEAQDNLLRRTVAMKVLLPETQADPGQVLAFIREMQITAQLPHAGVLPVYDFGLDEQIGLFSATRFVEGQSLADLLAGMAAGEHGARPATLHSLLQIFLKACGAVAFAHTRGVVHGGLRPEAIILGRFGEVFVDHWGAARLGTPPSADQPPVQAPEASAAAALSRYTAPEQVEGLDLDPRTDVYALGAILFRILTLRDFVEGDTAEELHEHLLAPPRAAARAFSERPPPAHLPGGRWPEYLMAVCARALSPARGDRLPGANELRREVGNWIDGMMGSSGPPQVWKRLAGLLGRR